MTMTTTTTTAATPAVVPALAEAVIDQLACGLTNSATFLCERMYAAAPTEKHAILLATCHARADAPYRVVEVLRSCETPAARFMFAKACYDMGRFDEAERAILMPDGSIAGGAKGRYLLGEVCLATDRAKPAAGWFAEALSLDPYLWCAFERLCTLGADEEAAIAMTNAEHVAVPPTPTIAAIVNGFVDGAEARADTHLTAATTALRDVAMDDAAARAQTTPAVGANVTTPAEAPPPTTGERRSSGAATATRRRTTPRNASAATPATPATPAGAIITPGEPPPPPRRRPPQAPSTALRRSSRLSGGSSGGDAALEATPAPLNSSPQAGAEYGDVEHEGPLLRESVRHPRHPSHHAALSLLRGVAEGVGALAAYRCAEAEAALRSLPPEQLGTAYVQCALGRCRFELGDYAGAADRYAEALRADPTRLEGVDVYSTALWQLRREVELSHLAQRCVSLDRWNPYAWCAAGNAMSLQREHESALRLFRRAIQLEPALPYAHTLCGHERLAVEDLEGAMACYRTALRYDARHYNAWYGLGQCYLRQEKHGLAEMHFRRALEIHPRSSVLCCYLGVSLHKLYRTEEALAVLDSSSLADPLNPLARYEKAHVLMDLSRYEEAIEELEALRDHVAPNEAQVHYQIGRAYKKLGRVDVAMRCFTAALDLKPSSAEASAIRSAIENVESEEGEEVELL
ncbi:anaphase-promoting complex subunit [Pycnococcus provasolii]